MLYFKKDVVKSEDEFVRLVDSKTSMQFNVKIGGHERVFKLDGIYSRVDHTSAFNKSQEPRYSFVDANNPAELMVMYIRDNRAHIEIRNMVTRVIEAYQCVPSNLGLIKKGTHYGFSIAGKVAIVGQAIRVGDVLHRTKNDETPMEYHVIAANDTSIVCSINDKFRVIHSKETDILNSLQLVYMP